MGEWVHGWSVGQGGPLPAQLWCTGVALSLRLGTPVYSGLDVCHVWSQLVIPLVDQQWEVGSFVGSVIGKHQGAVLVVLALEWE